MAKNGRGPRRERTAKAAPPVDGLTVGWMVTLLTTLFCELGALATRWYARQLGPDAKAMLAFSGLLLFSAAVIGLVLLALTPIVVYRKRSHPPRYVVALAVVVGLSPWLGMLLQAQG